MSRPYTQAMILATLFLTACGPKEVIRLNPPPPPATYLVCADLPDTPDLDPLTATRETYVKSEVDARDSFIVRYILDLRAAHFDCANQLGKVRDYYEAQE